jgi:hypothetical protein
MKSGDVQHLDDEQLIQSVVDASDLPGSVQAHLTECGQCLAGKNSFELEMTTLSQKAEQFAPQPQRRIMLPAQKSKNPFRNLLDWHNLVAAAATVAAVFILVWGTNLVRNLSEPGIENLTADMVESERLMTEVKTLVDNALPPFYLVLSGENNAGYDDDFYQFLIPTIEEKT